MGDASNAETQYQDDPRGWAGRIGREFEAARKALEGWRKDAEAAIKAYLDEGRESPRTLVHWNVFTSDIQTLRAMMFGSDPSVSVSRRFADPSDDAARVSGEMLERVLNSDIQGDDDTFRAALQSALEDSLLVDFGLVRIRYDIGEMVQLQGVAAKLDPVTGAELAPAVPGEYRRPNERVETDYVHHGDVLWSPARVWSEVRWVAFGVDVPIPEMQRRFGAEVVERLPVAGKESQPGQTDGRAMEAAGPWDHVRLWEVWMRDTREVFWYVEGADSVLAPKGVKLNPSGGQADPLELPGFFPCPAPMVMNAVTVKYVPKPDYCVAQDIYKEINDLSTRIGRLERALRVVGVYDAANPQLQSLLTDSSENKMIPVTNFAALATHGGLDGAVDWMPLDRITAALMTLREYRMEQLNALRQITGMSDVMRGQAAEPGRTATQDRIMARFGSVRLQWRQQRFAKFASEVQTLRARVMSRRFEDATLLERSNVMRTPDAQLAPQALELLRQRGQEYRIQIQPESLAMTDFDALKNERTEVAAAISQFIAAVMPLIQAMPQALPEVLELLQWVVAGVRGGSDIEAVLDRAIESAKQAGPQLGAQGGQSGADAMKLQTQQLKGQQEMAKEQFKLRSGLLQAQAEVQAKAQIEKNQADANVEETARKLLLQQAARRSMGETNI